MSAEINLWLSNLLYSGGWLVDGGSGHGATSGKSFSVCWSWECLGLYIGSNSQFELLVGVEREMAVEALEHEGEELRPTGKIEIARQRSQVIKEGLTAH